MDHDLAVTNADKGISVIILKRVEYIVIRKSVTSHRVAFDFLGYADISMKENV